MCVCVVCSGNIGSVFPSCLKASASPWSIRVYGCGNSLEPPLASSSISIREPSLVPFSSLSNWMAKRQKPPELRYRHRWDEFSSWRHTHTHTHTHTRHHKVTAPPPPMPQQLPAEAESPNCSRGKEEEEAREKKINENCSFNGFFFFSPLAFARHCASSNRLMGQHKHLNASVLQAVRGNGTIKF